MHTILSACDKTKLTMKNSVLFGCYQKMQFFETKTDF